MPPLGNSDHICLRFHFDIAISSNKYTRPHYKLNSGDYDNMRFLLDEINWYAMNDMTPDEAWQYFFNNFNTIIDRTVPKSNSKVKYKNVYINKEAMKLRKRKLPSKNGLARNMQVLQEYFLQVLQGFLIYLAHILEILQVLQ